MLRRIILLGVSLALGLGHLCAEEVDEEFFERHIRPVLVERCYGCHSTAAGKSEGGLLLDSRQAVLEGGESGPAIAPGDPQTSLLLEALRYESFEMPPDKPLSSEEIARFERWILKGAIDPREQPDIAQPGAAVDWEVASDYWSFKPFDRPQPPAVQDAGWCLSAIDRFVLAKLESQGLTPAEEATRWQWLRRVTYDLTGLPPSLRDQERFVEDASPQAYQRVVDRLLASPQYGERWGRHWLDLARYADTNGADENHAMPVAWRYRDYVVAAFNKDKPYDRFLHEQLAGDLLPFHDEESRREALTATGFLALGPKMLAEQDKPKLVADIVDEQIDTVGKVFMGLTLGCARCHDHKFDPITANDYYSLAGIFHSTRTMEHLDHVSQWLERPLPDSARESLITAHESRVKAAQDQHVALVKRLRDIEFEWTLAQVTSALSAIETEIPMAAQDESAESKLAQFVSESPVFSLWRKELVALHDHPDSQSHLNLVWVQLRATAETASDAKPSLQPALAQQLLELSPQPPVSGSQFIELAGKLFERRWLALEQRPPQAKLELKNPIDKRLFGAQGLLPLVADPSRGLSDDQLQELASSQQSVKELEEATPEPHKVMSVDDANVKLVALHVRGNHLQLQGDPIPRNVPSVLQMEQLPPPDFPGDSSGRLELAQWLTSPEHPLTARVMANRIWQGHFGRGLVASPSNFGLRGSLPSHPDLLDWLASELQQQNWSIKHLHRQIVLSRTYRMTSASDRYAGLDPDNQFLWKQNRRRLEAESVRDTLLALTGEWDTQIGRTAAAPQGEYEDLQVPKTALDAPRRTLYLTINRAALDDFFSSFDYVDPAATLAQRPSTIVPHQALFLMNHPLAMHAGRRISDRVLASTQDAVGRIEAAYRIVLQRSPTSDEVQTFLAFLGTLPDAPPEVAWARGCRGLLLTNEFLYVD